MILELTLKGLHRTNRRTRPAKRGSALRQWVVAIEGIQIYRIDENRKGATCGRPFSSLLERLAFTGSQRRGRGTLPSAREEPERSGNTTAEKADSPS